MRKLYPTELKDCLVSALKGVDDVEIGGGNPFRLTIFGNKYLIFAKNVSPAYFPASPDITRIQLPTLPEFNTALAEGIPIVVLGYDSANDTFVNWETNRMKARINSRPNISLYSRASFQHLTNRSEFRTAAISTGEEILIFSREQLPEFFNRLSIDHIPENKQVIDVDEGLTGTLTVIEDPEVLNILTPLLERSKIFEAAEKCYNIYGRTYKSMKIGDWLSLVTKIHEQIASKVT